MKIASDWEFALPLDVVADQTRKRKQPLQERARVTVDAILEATLQLLLSDGGVAGLNGLNTTRIAARAGVSVGTLYQYFPDKKSLLMTIKTLYMERVMGAIHGLIVAQIGQPLPLALRAIISGVIGIKTQNMDVTLAVQAASDWPAVDAAMKAATLQLCEAMEALFIAADPEMAQPRTKATVLVSAVDGAIHAAIAADPALLQDRAFQDSLIMLTLGFAH